MPGGNPFDDMSHECMLRWLDQANSGTVQAAADRLAKAAEEIHKIAEELKIRPQWVEWKGEGANAFRTWTADLANSTLRLGDFSESSAKWLAQASSAIARAQATIPRDTGAAESNRVAAASVPNDPDADAVSTKSAAELAALAENKEKVRQEAAAEMIKLGQAYEFSAVQLNALERPKFPPPPEAFVPVGSGSVRDNADQMRRDESVGGMPIGEGNATLGAPRSRESAPDVSEARRILDVPPRERVAAEENEPPTRMGIDSVETLLPDKQSTTGPLSGPPGPGRPDGSGSLPQTSFIPSVPRGGPGFPAGSPPVQGRPGTTNRMPHVPSQTIPAPNPGRATGGTGIVGGRPVTPPMGGATGATHRGTVVGAPGPSGRPQLGTTGTTTPRGRAVGQYGQTPGHRLPSPNGGVVGGTPQRTGRVTSGNSSSVDTGSTGSATATSGMTRNGVAGGTSGAASAEARGQGATRTPRLNSADAAGRNAQTRRSASEKETRRSGSGRIVPPVVD